MTSASEHTRDGDNIGTDDNDDNNDTSRSSTPPSLSINRLVALHARERLLVHPFLWTKRQLNLLQCRFHPHCEVDGPEQDLSASGPVIQHGTPTPASSPERSGEADARRLLKGGGGFTGISNIIYGLLGSVGYSVSSGHGDKSARLHFRHHSPVKIDYRHMVFSTPTGNATCLEFALFDFSAIYRGRHKFLFPPDRRYHDGPGIRRGWKLMKLYTPTDRNQDPFLVAVVIALAQRQRREWRESPKTAPSGHTVRLVFAGTGKPSPLILYVAQVQDAFLDKLRFPERVPSDNSGLDIHCWHLSAEPYETLAQRLLRALRSACDGQYTTSATAASYRDVNKGNGRLGLR